jgi:hypothetical protein
MYTDPLTSWTRDTKTLSSSFGACYNPHNKGNNHSERGEKVGAHHIHTGDSCLLIYLCCWVFMYIHFAVVLVVVVAVVAADRVVRVAGLG